MRRRWPPAWQFFGVRLLYRCRGECNPDRRTRFGRIFFSELCSFLLPSSSRARRQVGLHKHLILRFHSHERRDRRGRVLISRTLALALLLSWCPLIQPPRTAFLRRVLGAIILSHSFGSTQQLLCTPPLHPSLQSAPHPSYTQLHRSDSLESNLFSDPSDAKWYRKAFSADHFRVEYPSFCLSA